MPQDMVFREMSWLPFCLFYFPFLHFSLLFFPLPHDCARDKSSSFKQRRGPAALACGAVERLVSKASTLDAFVHNHKVGPVCV
jgi:hypothetical protein